MDIFYHVKIFNTASINLVYLTKVKRYKMDTFTYVKNIQYCIDEFNRI